MPEISTYKAAVAELIGTALLVACVVGSGIMAERLSGGNAALALLANSVATGAVLVTLIFTFAPISGAHFNPAVSIASAVEGGFPWGRVPGYVLSQFVGAFLGVVTANLMFGFPPVVLSTHARSGAAQMFSEVVATFGLLVVVHGTGKRAGVVPLTVAAYITAAYWFTSSTAFANPAVTLARSLTDTFTGIRPADVAGFVIAQIVGALLATILFRWLLPASVDEIDPK
ncbi:MAG TPA: MIP/aquaporin family protein [Thermoanaerobaculia bacterium]|nr:MIP/aquaporin family protein [Thermoanaerobaculia bacterium]